MILSFLRMILTMIGLAVVALMGAVILLIVTDDPSDLSTWPDTPPDPDARKKDCR